MDNRGVELYAIRRKVLKNFSTIIFTDGNCQFSELKGSYPVRASDDPIQVARCKRETAVKICRFTRQGSLALDYTKRDPVEMSLLFISIGAYLLLFSIVLNQT
jgi:hypothetical protein